MDAEPMDDDKLAGKRRRVQLKPLTPGIGITDDAPLFDTAVDKFPDDPDPDAGDDGLGAGDNGVPPGRSEEAVPPGRTPEAEHGEGVPPGESGGASSFPTRDLLHDYHGGTEVPGEEAPVPGSIEERLLRKAERVTHGLLVAAERVTPARRVDSIGHYGFCLAKQLKTVRGMSRYMRECDPTPLWPAIRHAAAMLEVDQDRLFEAVCGNWRAVTSPGNVLTAAVDAAHYYPITLVGPLASTTPLFQGVMSTAYWLQETAGEAGTIVLPQKDLAEVYGVTPRGIGKILRMGRDFGLLHLVDAFFRYSLGIAQDWRFDFDCPHYRPPDGQALAAARRKAHGIPERPVGFKFDFDTEDEPPGCPETTRHDGTPEVPRGEASTRPL
jgi:hypothetical protein